MISEVYFTSLSTGIIYGIGAVGLGLIYKYLKFPDFTTTVSIVAGAVVMGTVAENNAASIITGFILSLITGGFLGLITYIQIRYVKVNSILAGIITSTGALSLIYLITNNEATINLKEVVILDYVLNVKFTWWNVGKLAVLGFLICWGISSLFRTRCGLYILGLLGTENYIRYRHHNREKARLLLLVLGNSVISFSGAFLTTQSLNCNVDGTKDFLVIALSGYVLSSFIIQLSNKLNKSHLDKDNKMTGNMLIKLYRALIHDKLSLNDEEPAKICCFLVLVVAGTTFVNLFFQLIDVHAGSDNKVTYLLKAGIFLGLLALGNLEKVLSHKND